MSHPGDHIGNNLKKPGQFEGDYRDISVGSCILQCLHQFTATPNPLTLMGYVLSLKQIR
jgi:hypothetical protein